VLPSPWAEVQLWWRGWRWVWGDDGPWASMARVCCLLGFQLGEGDAGRVGLHCHVVISHSQIQNTLAWCLPQQDRPKRNHICMPRKEEKEQTTPFCINLMRSQVFIMGCPGKLKANHQEQAWRACSSRWPECYAKMQPCCNAL